MTYSVTIGLRRPLKNGSRLQVPANGRRVLPAMVCAEDPLELPMTRSRVFVGSSTDLVLQTYADYENTGTHEVAYPHWARSAEIHCRHRSELTEVRRICGAITIGAA